MRIVTLFEIQKQKGTIIFTKKEVIIYLAMIRSSGGSGCGGGV
jgi:hypothetical protein